MPLQISTSLPIPVQPTFSTLDSTKIMDYSTCPRKYFFLHLLGLRSASPNHHLVFGSAWHEAREFATKNNYDPSTLQEAFEVFLTEYRKDFDPATDDDFRQKNPGQAMQALTELYSRHEELGNSQDEVVATEVSGPTLTPAGHEIIYKLDCVSKNPVGQIYAQEYKTGGAKWAWWIDEKQTRFQIRTYNAALQGLYGSDAKYVLVRGTFFTQKVQWLDVPVYFTPLEMENWGEEADWHISSLQADFDRLVDDSIQNKTMKSFQKRTSSCVSYNRMCPFYSVCFSSINPIKLAEFLPSGMKREFWDPSKGKKNE